MDVHKISLCIPLYKVDPIVVGWFGTSRLNAHFVTTTPTEITTPPPPTSMPSSSLDGGLFIDEIAAFRCFVSQLNHSPNVLSSSFVYSGTTASALSATVSNPPGSWVIDSGASHHMTGMSSSFSSYMVSSGKNMVRIADGSFSSIVGQGDIPITPELWLSSVLHVLKFTLNLLSVSHITKALNCCVTFFPSHCVFQDIVTKRTIGLGHGNDGLYLLHPSLPVATPAIKRDTSTFRSNELFIWHRLLGHLFFSMLKKMFPQLSYSRSNFFCKPCQLAKHCRAVYPLSNHNKSSVPFSLMHSNVWGTLSYELFVWF